MAGWGRRRCRSGGGDDEGLGQEEDEIEAATARRRPVRASNSRPTAAGPNGLVSCGQATRGPLLQARMG
jgi:hypothetical protein